MKLLIDTNVIVNYLLGQNDFESAREIFRLAENNEEYECVSSSAATDINYIISKARYKANQALDESVRKTKKEVMTETSVMISKFLEILHILAVTEEQIHIAFNMGWEDSEDALQYVVALSNDVDVIITENPKDYRLSTISVKRPLEFLQEYQKEDEFDR